MSSRLGAGLVLGMCLGMPAGLILFPPIPETKVVTIEKPAPPPEIKEVEKVVTVKEKLPDACYEVIDSSDKFLKGANSLYSVGSNVFQHLHDIDQRKLENSFDLFETEVYLNRNLLKMKEDLYVVLEESSQIRRRQETCKEEMTKD